ncbi:MAG: HD domain-containing protein [Nitrososphaerota archaeon]
MKLIKDPVHGYITLTDEEVSLLDTFAVQRLRRISQIPLAYLVYPGARHSRFDHSLGCLSLAYEFSSHLGLEAFSSLLLRFSALLHDIGHTPYSHLLEMKLIENGLNHEEMGIRIIGENDEISSTLERAGVPPREIINVIKGKSRLSSLISGPLDVDRLDFLVRDAYFTGATYGVVDIRRLIHLTRLDEHGSSVDIRGLGAVEELAIARHHSFLNIYFHHTVRAAQLLFYRAFDEIADEVLNFSKMSVEEYLRHDDYTVWSILKNNPKTRIFIEKIERRRLPKMVYERKTERIEEAFSSNKEKSRIEKEIAHESKIDERHIYLDSSMIPPLTKFGVTEIRLHSEEAEVQPRSWILEMTSKPLGIVRVYVDRDYVDRIEKIRKAAETILSPVK